MAFYSATLTGVDLLPVEIEIDLFDGLPFFQIVGLPDAVLRESKTRVKSAILQSGFDFPHEKRVVLNLSPSKVKKEGSGFELGLAARILASSGQMEAPGHHVLFLGELALDGKIRMVREIAALALAANQEGLIQTLVVPMEAADRIGSHVDCFVVGVNHLNDLRYPQWWTRGKRQSRDKGSPKFEDPEPLGIKFSEFWARHLEIAAVGRHHYLLCGPPGSGKTFFAESLRVFISRSSLPEEETRQKVLDAIFQRDSQEIPWAAPHHSVTTVGLLGGGGTPRPGAVTRAHGGVLFLDELLEFSPAVLDSLREPLERGFVEIYRAGNAVTFPSRVQLLGATNPCRCGNWRHPTKPCKCGENYRETYQRKISGPFFERFDLGIFCPPPMGNEKLVSSRQIVQRISKALDLKKSVGHHLGYRDVDRYLQTLQSRELMDYRSQKRAKRVAETLALLDGQTTVKAEHIEKACLLQTLKSIGTGV